MEPRIVKNLVPGPPVEGRATPGSFFTSKVAFVASFDSSISVVSGSSTTAAQTGDKTNTPLWIAAAAGSVVAALGAFVIRRKKNSEE